MSEGNATSRKRDPRLDGANALWGDGDDHALGFGLAEIFKDARGVLRRRVLWVLGAAALGIVATCVALFSWEPRYVARATILISGQQIPEDFVRSTVQEDTIRNIDPVVRSALTHVNLSRILERFDLYRELAKKQTTGQMVEKMRQNVRVSPSQAKKAARRQDSLVYDVAFTDRDPEMAADIANALGALFVEASMERRRGQAERTTEFLRAELGRDEKELSEQSARVAEFRRAHLGELPDELDTNLRKLELLGSRRQSLIAQISEKENLMRMPGGAMGESEALLGELRRQLAREQAVNTDEHPNVISLRRRVAAQEALIMNERSAPRSPSGYVPPEQLALGNLRTQLAQTDAAIDALNQRIERTPEVGEELTALEGKESVLREDYLQSLRKVEEAELAESLEAAQQGSQISILDPARAPSQPERPRWLVALMGLALTIAASLGIAFLLELVDPVVLAEEQFEGLSERPFLGSLPRVS